MLDLISKIDKDRKVRYIWFDTGLEYQATKDHLKYLEEKYHIEIERIKAIKPIPLSCSEYGQPFLSKFVSDMISRLQRHGFTWEDKPVEQLLAEYPKAQGAINWWCNGRNKPGFKTSMFNINYHKYLKEFMIENPPWFKISSKCCTYVQRWQDSVRSLSDFLQPGSSQDPGSESNAAWFLRRCEPFPCLL